MWERYQQEGVPQEISIVRYCQMNGVPYKTFERWYKSRTNTNIQPVVVEMPQGEYPATGTGAEALTERSGGSMTALRVESVTLLFTNGLEIRQRDMEYAALKSLISKLEALCLG